MTTPWEEYKNKPKTTPWQDYKKKLGTTRPWNYIDGSERADDVVADARYAMCLACDRFNNLTKTCKECGCLMRMKSRLKAAACPINKWGAVPDVDK